MAIIEPMGVILEGKLAAIVILALIAGILIGIFIGLLICGAHIVQISMVILERSNVALSVQHPFDNSTLRLLCGG